MSCHCALGLQTAKIRKASITTATKAVVPLGSEAVSKEAWEVVVDLGRLKCGCPDLPQPVTAVPGWIYSSSASSQNVCGPYHNRDAVYRLGIA